jgi:hypothetical protein
VRQTRRAAGSPPHSAGLALRLDRRTGTRVRRRHARATDNGSPALRVHMNAAPMTERPHTAPAGSRHGHRRLGLTPPRPPRPVWRAALSMPGAAAPGVEALPHARSRGVPRARVRARGRVRVTWATRGCLDHTRSREPLPRDVRAHAIIERRAQRRSHERRARVTRKWEARSSARARAASHSAHDHAALSRSSNAEQTAAHIRFVPIRSESVSASCNARTIVISTEKRPGTPSELTNACRSLPTGIEGCVDKRR